MIEQPYLDGFLKADAEARESSVDRETFIRHKQALAKRWIGYYLKCKDKSRRGQLIAQYYYLAKQR